jgi:ubiquinone/menaquinone biosynthesis C-methylase UbiE
MRSLPTGDNAWAGITAFYAIVNLSPADVAQALHEMMRVLVPNGRLLLSFHIGEDTSQVEELWNSGAALEFHFDVRGFCGRIVKAPYTTYYGQWQAVLCDPEQQVFRLSALQAPP